MTSHFAFCIDQHFAPHLGVLMQSVIDSPTGGKYHFHVLSGELDEGTRTVLESCVSGDHQISIYIIDDAQIDGLPISSQYAERMSAITYYRLLLPTVLPADVTLILYLDADMVVRGDLTPLLAHELNQHVVAVVEDIACSRADYTQSLGLTEGRYFNAGMLLINLPAWREHDITAKCFALLASGRQWRCNDQDVLNIALESLCDYLPAIWNWQLVLRNPNTGEPCIVHFNGSEKPWHHSSVLPFTDDYLLHKANSVYREVPLELALDSHDKALLNMLAQDVPATLIIYGAGIKGRRLALAIASQYPSIKIEALVDRAPPFAEFNGIPVFTQVPTGFAGAVVVASKAYAGEISAELTTSGFTHILARVDD